MLSERPVEIWLIDDDDGHALLVEESLEEARLRNDFVRAKDGDEGWQWLQEAAEGKRPRPGLILLDVSMPGLDGFQVLERIKANPALKNIPVVMLTSTDAPREIQRAYDLGCNAYVLCHQKGINGCRKKGKEVVIAWFCLTLKTPFVKAIKVGTEGQHHRCFLDHGLIKVAGKQLLLYMHVGGDHYGIDLHVPCG